MSSDIGRDGAVLERDISGEKSGWCGLGSRLCCSGQRRTVRSLGFLKSPSTRRLAMNQFRLLFCVVVAGVALSPTAWAQASRGRGDIQLRLVVLDSLCETAAGCSVLVPELLGTDSLVLESRPGDQYVVGLKNVRERPLFGALAIFSSAHPRGLVTWPRPIRADELLLSPDTVVIESRLETGLIVVLVHSRYFTPDEVPEVPRDIAMEHGIWAVDPIVRWLSANESGIQVSQVCFHTTKARVN
jgi:hypothetical protein